MSSEDRIGVCIQPDTTGPYVQTAKLAAAMQHLGLSLFRVRAPLRFADSWNRIYVPLAKLGYRFCFTHAPGQDPTTEVSTMAELAKSYPGCVVAYEGPNEPDLNPVTYGGRTDARMGARTGNAPAALALLKAQWTALRKIKAFGTAQVDMVSFNDWMQREQAGYTGFGNTHIYPSDDAGMTGRIPQLLQTQAAARNDSCYVTEWGYHNLIGSGIAAPGVSDAEAAHRIAQDVPLILATPQIKRAFYFDLLDGTGAVEQSHFGLFRPDWTAKSAAEAMRAAIRAG